jgi:peptidoglycan/LPS O-acetylase OafA/YrhL
VLVYHIRYRFFVDFSEVTTTGPLALAWYTLTSFGHDAVMVFFVLSGFLIGSSVVADAERARWSWTRYLTNRAVRLYVVLLPGLVITALCDSIGVLQFPQHEIYSGAPAGYRHDFFDVIARLGPGVFLQNALFLQGISAPPFGSNEALWSLSFEFWYYLLFPLLLVPVIAVTSWKARIVSWTLAIIAIWVMNRLMLVYFPIWLLGVLLSLVPWTPPLRRGSTAVFAAAIAFVGVVATLHTGSFRSFVGGSIAATDYATALSFAALLVFVLHDRRPSLGGWYSRVASVIAGFSFTLYVVHLPVLVLLRAWLVPVAAWTPTPFHIAVGLAIAGGVLVLAIVVAWATEARTSLVRQWVLHWYSSAGSERAVSVAR